MEDKSRNDAFAVGSTISCFVFKFCGSLCSGRSRVADNGSRASGPAVGGGGASAYGTVSAAVELGSNGGGHEEDDVVGDGSFIEGDAGPKPNETGNPQLFLT